MGVIATVAGGLAVLFPETLGRYLNGIFSTPILFSFWTLDEFFCSRRLPESMEEALNIGKKKLLPGKFQSNWDNIFLHFKSNVDCRKGGEQQRTAHMHVSFAGRNVQVKLLIKNQIS